MTEPLTIRLWDDPILSAVAEKLDDNEFGPQLEEFARQMVATMDAAHGIGLAAPQVGVLKRMFVMHSPDHDKVPPIVVCNPVVILSGSSIPGREGCLSIPNVWDQVTRAGHVNMCYRQPDGKPVELILDMMDARVAQHEFDHLNGIMFFDYKDQRRAPFGARMSRQVSKSVLRRWDKEKKNHGL